MLPVIELLFMGAASASTGTLTPALGEATISDSAGSCPSNDASLVVSWTVINPDDATYELHVLENGGLASTQLCSSTSFTKPITGFIESGPYRQFTSRWTFVIQLVRKSDGVVIASRTASEWVVLYGACDAFVS